MCCLNGIAGNLQFQDEFTMKRFLLFGYFRGEHSTGMAAIRTNGDAVIAKIDSNPINLWDMGQFKSALNGSASRAFLGHNRQATRGGVNTANAHPFKVDHITGMHNGTLDYKSLRRLEQALEESFSVDSLAIITGIAKLGIEETLALCEEGKDAKEGAWALVWHDQKEGTLNFIRNKHRSLYYAFEEGFKRMFWASEWWMIREAMEESTNKYKVYSEKKKDKTIGYFLFDEDIHYKFDLAELCKGSVKRPKPKVKKIKGREPEVQSNVVPFEETSYHNPMGFQLRQADPARQTHGTPTGNVGSHNSHQKTECSSTTTLKKSSDKKRQCVQMIGVPKFPYANIINEGVFKNIAQDGCSFCETDLEFGDTGVIIFERDGRILCPECSGFSSEVKDPPSRIYVRSATIDAFS